MYHDKLMLFDLEKDKGEIYDIASQKPEIVEELKSLYDQWDNQMAEPLWISDGHVPATKRRLDEYTDIRKAASKGERKK